MFTFSVLTHCLRIYFQSLSLAYSTAILRSINLPVLVMFYWFFLVSGANMAPLKANIKKVPSAAELNQNICKDELC